MRPFILFLKTAGECDTIRRFATAEEAFEEGDKYILAGIWNGYEIWNSPNFPSEAGAVRVLTVEGI